MALPDSWVDHLFGKLAIRYGDAWFRKWDGIPMHAVRADWAEVLDGVSGSSIAYGLKNLPSEFPPNSDAFRALCNGGPVNHPTALALPAPVQIDAEQSQRLREKVASGFKPKPAREWAYRLQARNKDGARLTPAQIDAYRAVVGMADGEPV